MLSQKHRLSKFAEVKKTTAKGRSFFNPFFVIKFLPEDHPPRITVVTSVKVSKKAVDRNRVKRIIREGIRKYIEQIKPGNYAVLVKAAAVKISGKELREQVEKSLKIAKII